MHRIYTKKIAVALRLARWFMERYYSFEYQFSGEEHMFTLEDSIKFEDLPRGDWYHT